MRSPIHSKRLLLASLVILAGCLPFGPRNGPEEVVMFGSPRAACEADRRGPALRIPATEIGRYAACWYSEALDSLREIPMAHPLAPGDTVLRLLWLRPVNPPVAIRLQNIGSGWSASISVAEILGSDRIGTFRSRLIRPLTPVQADSLIVLLAATSFDDTRETGGFDGATWVFELVTGSRYQLQDRHSPRPGTPFRQLGEWMIHLIEQQEVREPIY